MGQGQAERPQGPLRCQPRPHHARHGATGSNWRRRAATARGDVEELVAIKSRDLASGHGYLEIAEIWVKAGQPDKALAWAEHGLKAFPQRPDNRLRDFLVTAYLDHQRNDEALALTWVQFDENPRLQTFSKLQAVAGKLGTWPVQRERALSGLDDSIAREAAMTNRWKPKPSVPNQSLPVDIALWEEDLDAAWAAAHRGICDRHLLILRAGKLEAGRPEDAVSLYRRVVPLIVETTLTDVTRRYLHAERGLASMLI